MNNKVLLAMSGGMDSSISIKILQDKGYEVHGITFILWKQYRANNQIINNDLQYVTNAQNVAKAFNISHIVMDLTDYFNEKVICPFVNTYLNGHTPNPCVVCNKHVKFKVLHDKAQELDCDYISTGHYANVKHNNEKYYISKGIDSLKDQSYVLWALPQQYLSKIIFPLGNMNKSTQTKELVKQYGIQEFICQKESFDICFVPDNNYQNVLLIHKEDELSKLNNGEIILNNKVIGYHKGYPFYTIGQRKNLGVAVGYPVYVKNIDKTNNRVIVSDNNGLLLDQLVISNVNMMKYEKFDEDKIYTVKIRYHDKGTSAKVKYFIEDSSKVIINFQSPVRAITPGQSAVIYENDDVVGGGIIQ